MKKGIQSLRRPSLRRVLLGAVFIGQISSAALAQEGTTTDPTKKVDPNAQTEEVPAAEGEAQPQAPTPGPVTNTLAPISVTATREATTLSETPANVSVITRDDMDRRMQNSIQDLIRYEPGIIVDRQTSGTDPFKSLGGFTIRGVSGNRILTLVDGNRVIERITDQTRDFVDLGNMKSVEIVRGPASALWGSDALGGVVAFTTKDPEDYLDPKGDDWGFQTNSTYSTLDNAFTENATAAARYGKLEGLVSYTRRDADEPELTKAKNNGVWGPCPRESGSIKCNEFDPMNVGSDNILAKLVFDPNEDHQFKLTGEYFHRNTETEQVWDHGRAVNANGTFSAIRTLDYERQQILDRRRLTLEHEWNVDASFLDSVDWQFTYHPQDTDRNGVRKQRLANGQITVREDSLLYSEEFFEGQSQFKSSFDIGDITNDLTYGFYASHQSTDYERKDVLHNLTLGTTTTTIAGGFNFANAVTTRIDGYLQNNIGLFDDRLNIIPGVRYATYNINPDPGPGYVTIVGKEPRTISESDLAAKLGITYQLDDNFSLYGQYGEGFKMPTAEQLFTSLPFGAQNLVPNPNLKAEESKNYEIGVRGEFDNGFFSVNGFYTDYKNFIQNFVQVNATDITYANLSKVEIWGIEGSGAWQFHPNWEIDSAMSWQIGNTVATPGDEERPFNGAEPFKIVTGLRYMNDDLGLDAELIGTYQMAMSRLNDAPAEDFGSDDYFVLDANVTWRPIENVALRGSILNILDERYFLPSVSSFDATPSGMNVAATNPIELQTQPGRTFLVGLGVSF